MENEVLINEVVEQNIRLIAVASQLFGNKNPFEIDFLVDKKGNRFEILEHFEYNKKDDIFPGGMFILATGERLSAERVWNAYKKSDIIYFFIVKKI